MNLNGRVGLFGGTFNPVHNAHVLVAQQALEHCGLSHIVFVPVGIHPVAKDEATAEMEDRYQMVLAAIRNEPRMSVSRIEMEREGPSYTIDTIRALKDDYAEGICFIVGADLLLAIDTWKEPEALLRSVPFVVAPRAGVDVGKFTESPFDEASIVLLDMDEVCLSSTGVREAMRRGETIEELVPAEVARYIEEHRLYREASARTANRDRRLE